jgi:tRNA G18 (ribose-2'-O)-methylase SpoU
MRKLSNKELGRKTVSQYQAAEKNPFVIILDNIRSLSNVGSVFRTADAFLTEKVCLCGITAVPPHRDIQKTALGATESVSWEYYPATITAVRELKELNYTIIGFEQASGSVYLQDLKLNKGEKYALIFGNEVNGVDQEVLDECDICVEIPQFGTKHSINIAVSAGIAVWEVWRKLTAATYQLP